MAKSGFVTPKVAFSTINYSNIEAGSYFFGFDLDNAGKLSKMDNLGNITVIEGADVVIPDGVYELGAGTESAQLVNTLFPNAANADYAYAAGKNVVNNAEAGDVSGSANFAVSVYSGITGYDTESNIINVEDSTGFKEGNIVAYVYAASGNDNLVHTATILSIDANQIYVDLVVAGDGSEFHGINSPDYISNGVLFNLSSAPIANGCINLEGSYNFANSLNAHVEGRKCAALAQHSHAEGNQTVAYGQNSHSEGELTRSIGRASHTEGYQTSANGNYSHAEGYLTDSQAIASHAGGYGAVTSNLAEWARSGNGDLGQHGIYHITLKTTDATPTRITDLAYREFRIPNNSAYRVKIKIVVVETSLGDAKEFSGEGIIKNIGGTTSFVGGALSVSSTVGDAALAAVSVTANADDALDQLSLVATGIAKVLNWSATIDYISVKF